jgi:putative chitinase
MALLTEAQLAKMIPTNTEVAEWCKTLNDMLPKYGITTPQRIASFISQCAHESADFKLLEENLNYSKESLERVFPKYFGANKRNANEYARKPEKIANYVYMDEFRSKGGALGNVQEGDGWRFRGRGLKQVTGRSNYATFGKAIGKSAEEVAAYLETKEGALVSALWFWDSRNLNDVADTGDVARVTKIINGGDIGLEDRRRRYVQGLAVLTGQNPAGDGGGSSGGEGAGQGSGQVGGRGAGQGGGSKSLRVGSRGGEVAALQKALGITADGSFGPGTEKALKEWQQAQGLKPDGVAGPQTLAKLLA